MIQEFDSMKKNNSIQHLLITQKNKEIEQLKNKLIEVQKKS